MRPSHFLHLLLATLVTGCGDPNNNRHNDTDGNSSIDGSSTTDGSVHGEGNPTGSPGVCGNEIDILAAGTRMDNKIVFHGTTDGRPDNLHPYGGCVENDGPEMVFKYRVPPNVNALRISTEGSRFDTVLYVRENCSQAMGGADLVCNNDRYQDTSTAPESVVYLTTSPPLVEGRVLFIIVDGAGGASGDFTLTVEEVGRGGMGQPCRPETERNTVPRCDPPLRCSPGGSADGTPLCVPTVGVNMQCDPRGFLHTCVEGAYCVQDPTPAAGSMDMPVCALPGTRAGAPCRMTEPRCDAPFVCGTGDAPVCVRVLSTGEACDPTGATNACPMGQVCGPFGGGNGPAICHR